MFQAKPVKTVGRPIIPYRKVIDGILYIKNRMSMEDTTQRIWIRFLHIIKGFGSGTALTSSKRMNKTIENLSPLHWHLLDLAIH
ncbi:MAG TPA: hypothetical protein VIY08_06960 [Candidatus Nitrosocosmicus sp.]